MYEYSCCVPDGPLVSPPVRGTLKAAWGIPFVLSMTLGCVLPEGGQDSASDVHFRLVTARAAGDLDVQWDLLHPDIRDLFTRWQVAEQSAVRSVRLSYPEAKRKEALESLVEERADLPDARSLYGTLVPTAPGSPLTVMESLGARVLMDVSEDQGHAELITLARQRFQYRRGTDGLWYVWPTVEECSSLDAAVDVAEANLATVRRNLQVFRGERLKPTTE